MCSDCCQKLNLRRVKPRGGWKDIKSITLNELLDEFSADALKEDRYVVCLHGEVISRREITSNINIYYYHIMDAYEYATSHELRNHSAFVEGISRHLLQIEEILGYSFREKWIKNSDSISR